jgi:hypothetical protein
MTALFLRLRFYFYSSLLVIGLTACGGDALISGVDPFAPMVFKEGTTAMPLNPPNKSTTVPFYVSQATIFKFGVDVDSILIGADGVTRYTVIIGTFENGRWNQNPLSSWREIKSNIPNRYQAALAQGAFCNMSEQEKNIKAILQYLNPNEFTGSIRPPPL